MAAVLADVLGGARPGLVWSGVTGAGRERIEAEILVGGGASAVGPRLGEALAMGPLLALARAHSGQAPLPWLLTGTWRNDYGALLWSRAE
jgi:hypothetical protein